jgi:hypothetical protein
MVCEIVNLWINAKQDGLLVDCFPGVPYDGNGKMLRR